jgi:hypothetical protein
MVIRPVHAAQPAAVLALAPMALLALQQAQAGGRYDRNFAVVAAFGAIVVAQMRLRGACELLKPRLRSEFRS